MASAQIEARRNMILAPEHEKPQVNGKPVTEEFLKGEISGIRSFLQLPEVLVETTSEVIKSQEKVNEHGDESAATNE